MALTHLFQDFGTLKPASVERKFMNSEEIEELKLQAFEGGFQAGWEDAIKAQSQTVTYVSTGLAANLQNASFEYNELRRTLNDSVQSIMAEILRTILPLAAQEGLGAHICDLVGTLSLEVQDRPIEIAVAPGRDEVVRGVLASNLADPFEVVVDPMMSSNQATLRLGAKETEINLDKTVTEIESAVKNFFEIQRTEVSDA